MAGFGKNAPWARAPGTQQLNPQIFPGGQLGLPGQFGIPGLRLGMDAIGVQNQLLGLGAVGYGQQNLGGMLLNRGISQQQQHAALAAQQQHQQQQQAQQQQQKSPRTFVGLVTKMLENYGFVDDEVFFQTSVVKGPLPRVGERVMVEAAFNPNMAFKWNAIRVQLLPETLRQQVQPVEPERAPAASRWVEPIQQQQRMQPIIEQQQQHRRRDSPPRQRSPPARRASPPRRSRTPPPKRRSPSPRRPTLAPAKRSRSRSPSSRRGAGGREESLSSRRISKSPPRKSRALGGSSAASGGGASVTGGSSGRASVAATLVQKFPNIKDAGVIELKQRYQHLYIPSDFFLAHFRWTTSFPLHRSLSLDHNVAFHILHKEVDRADLTDGPAEDTLSLWDPPDSDYRYCAKVMLLSQPAMQEIYKKVIGLQEDGVLKDHDDTVQLSRVVSFLIGTKGKENLAIGGPWSPSLDGADPEGDPRVLIKTAIRNTKALTGLDLSKCTQWFKFLELHYRRIDKESLAKTQSADTANLDNERSLANGHLLGSTERRVDTVVIFVPDVWNIMPTKAEFAGFQESFKAKLQTKLDALEPKPEELEVVVPAEPILAAVPTPMEVTEQPTSEQPQPAGGTTSGAEEVVASPTKSTELTVQPAVEEPAKTTLEEAEEKSSPPTHWSKLNFDKMKVPELRAELDARGLESKGIKSQLIQRLQTALKAEEEADKAKEVPTESVTEGEAAAVLDENKEEAAVEEPEIMIIEEKKPEKSAAEIAKEEKEKQRLKEKEERERKAKKEQLQRHYSLGKDPQPGLVVVPHSGAKGGKFECKVVSLHSLLDYRVDDNKEHSFEVALFAEMFNALLARDSAFKIYKALLSAPDLSGEQKRKEDEEKRKKEEAEKKKEEEEIAKKLAEAQEAAMGDEKPLENGEAAEGTKDESEDLMDATELQVKDEVKEETEADQAIKLETAAAAAAAEEKKASAAVANGSAKDKDKRSGAAASGAASAPKEKKVSVVVNPDLLLAFGYFDHSSKGSLVDKDLEDIFNILGLNLTRSQINRILKKLIIKGETIHYRKLAEALKAKDAKFEFGSADTISQLEPAIESSEGPFVLPADADLANGNTSLVAGETPLTAVRGGVPSVGEASAVVFQGSVIDLAQLVAQLRRLESEQKAVELKNVALEKELKSSKEYTEGLEKKKRRLDDDLRDYKKRLTDTEKSLKTSTDDTAVLKSALRRVKDNADSIIRQVERAIPEKKKEDPSKKDSSAKKDEASKSQKDDGSPSQAAGSNAAAAESDQPQASLTNSEQPEDLAVRDEITESDKPEADMEG